MSYVTIGKIFRMLYDLRPLPARSSKFVKKQKKQPQTGQNIFFLKIVSKNSTDRNFSWRVLVFCLNILMTFMTSGKIFRMFCGNRPLPAKASKFVKIIISSEISMVSHLSDLLKYTLVLVKSSIGYHKRFLQEL